MSDATQGFDYLDIVDAYLAIGTDKDFMSEEDVKVHAEAVKIKIVVDYRMPDGIPFRQTIKQIEHDLGDGSVVLTDVYHKEVRLCADVGVLALRLPPASTRLVSENFRNVDATTFFAKISVDQKAKRVDSQLRRSAWQFGSLGFGS